MSLGGAWFDGRLAGSAAPGRQRRALAPATPGESKSPAVRGFCTRPERFELPTFGSVDRRSIQLSYGRLCCFWLEIRTFFRAGGQMRVPVPGARYQGIPVDMCHQKAQWHKLRSGGHEARITRRVRRPGLPRRSTAPPTSWLRPPSPSDYGETIAGMDEVPFLSCDDRRRPIRSRGLAPKDPADGR